MTTEINPDQIDIDYHINNLELFFSMFFIHWSQNYQKQNDLKKMKRIKNEEIKNEEIKNEEKSFFSLLNIFFKNSNPTETINSEQSDDDNQETTIDNSFDKSIYFINFPAFYYFEYKELNSLYNSFFELKDNYDKKEIKNDLKNKIKRVIKDKKSYKSLIKNFSHFNFNEINTFFNSDESIIYFFDLIKKKNMNYYDNFGVYENLTHYLISDVILHRQHLFESCFSDFPFHFVKKDVFECLTKYMFQNNTAHLFLPYVPSNIKKDFEKNLIEQQINSF